MWVQSLRQEDPLKRMATCSSILAWEIPWIEEPVGLQFMGWQRVWHDWATEQQNDELTISASQASSKRAWEAHSIRVDVTTKQSCWGATLHPRTRKLPRVTPGQRLHNQHGGEQRTSSAVGDFQGWFWDNDCCPSASTRACKIPLWGR